MRRNLALPVWLVLFVGCFQAEAPELDQDSELAAAEAQALSLIDLACDGKARGESCPSARGGESDQCDGQGSCVDCVNHIGCNESSVCDAVIQTCVNFVQPPSAQCTGAPRGTPCDLVGGGSDPDFCNGVGICVDCLSDAGCGQERYCDLFGEICLLRAAPTTPPPSPPPPAVSDISLGESCRASWVDLSN